MKYKIKDTNPNERRHRILIKINGMELMSWSFHTANSYSNIQFFASNPWEPSFIDQFGTVENLKVIPFYKGPSTNYSFQKYDLPKI